MTVNWKEKHSFWEARTSRAIGGRYEIVFHKAGLQPHEIEARLRAGQNVTGLTIGSGYFEVTYYPTLGRYAVGKMLRPTVATLEEAKALAEADHRQRVSSVETTKT